MTATPRFYTLQGSVIEPLGVAHARLRSSVHDLLSVFVPDPNALRSLMRRTGSIISGSAALYIVQPSTSWFPRDIDLYVTFDNFHRVVEALQQEQGAIIVDPAQLHAPYDGVAGICGVVRMRTARGCVEVIRSSSDSVLFPVTHFWTTLVMNVVTADFVCIAYPELTLRGRGLAAYRVFSAEEVDALAKYVYRGFEFRVRVGQWTDMEEFRLSECFPWMCTGCTRFFGDGGCLMVPFDE